MRTSYKYIMLFGGGLIAGVIIVASYFYIKQFEDTESIRYSLSAPELYSEYRSDEMLSNEKYLNKTIRIKGIVKEVYKTKDDKIMVWLRGVKSYKGVKCKIQYPEKEIKEPLKLGDSIVLVGRCLGMDSNVKLFECEIVQ